MILAIASQIFAPFGNTPVQYCFAPHFNNPDYCITYDQNLSL